MNITEAMIEAKSPPIICIRVLTSFSPSDPLAVRVNPRRPKIIQWVPDTGQENIEAIICHKPLAEKKIIT